MRPQLPPGASTPLVQARSIDDVPVMALTLWGAGYDDVQLRQMAGQLQETLKELPDISEVTIIGGRPRQVTVDLDPAALAARHLDPLAVQQALRARNVRTTSRQYGQRQPGDARSRPGSWLDVAGRASNTSSSATTDGTPVHLADVATVDGRRRRAGRLRDALPRTRPGVSGGDAVDRQAQGHQRDRR